MPEPSNAVIHFYRAAMTHADVWRRRLDITTNWAVITNAAVLTFALSSADTPHFVILLTLIIDIFFLVMESRRYQVYDLWHHRLRILHRYVFAEAFSDVPIATDEEIHHNLRNLAAHLGHTVARISLIDAIGYRIRRNYFYIMIFTVGIWLLKLDFHPNRPDYLIEIVTRAEMGHFSGVAVMSAVGVLIIAALYLAVRAPSEHLVHWSQLPSPLRRALRASWLPRSEASDELAELQEKKSKARRRKHPANPTPSHGD